MIPFGPLIPLLTRVGATLMARLLAKKAARKKILNDAGLQKKVKKLAEKALKKEKKNEQMVNELPKWAKDIAAREEQAIKDKLKGDAKRRRN